MDKLLGAWSVDPAGETKLCGMPFPLPQQPLTPRRGHQGSALRSRWALQDELRRSVRAKGGTRLAACRGSSAQGGDEAVMGKDVVTCDPGRALGAEQRIWR